MDEKQHTREWKSREEKFFLKACGTNKDAGNLWHFCLHLFGLMSVYQRMCRVPFVHMYDAVRSGIKKWWKKFITSTKDEGK